MSTREFVQADLTSMDPMDIHASGYVKEYGKRRILTSAWRIWIEGGLALLARNEDRRKIHAIDEQTKDEG
jgi:hypothetical protein